MPTLMITKECQLRCTLPMPTRPGFKVGETYTATPVNHGGDNPQIWVACIGGGYHFKPEEIGTFFALVQ